MQFPLAKLVSNLKEFPMMSNFFTPMEVGILKRKGVFPYEWFDSFDKLYRTKLPSREAFYSNLANGNIKVSDYMFASVVFGIF